MRVHHCLSHVIACEVTGRLMAKLCICSRTLRGGTLTAGSGLESILSRSHRLPIALSGLRGCLTRKLCFAYAAMAVLGTSLLV